MLTGVSLAALLLVATIAAHCEGGAPGGPEPFVPPDGSVVVGSCPEGGTCAQGICYGTQCFTLPDGAECQDDSACQPGLVCGALAVCCALAGQSSTTCCSGMVSDGVCACGPCTGACVRGAECCSGTCQDGYCARR
jgi:hypothetical protein